MDLTLTVEQTGKLQRAQSAISGILAEFFDKICIDDTYNFDDTCATCEGGCNGCETCDNTSTAR